jgi:LysM repeat protein
MTHTARITVPLRAAALAAAALLASSAALYAQDTTRAAVRDTTERGAAAAGATADSAGTHTVRKGDTLWDLARQYLSNPFLWPQIHGLNTTVVKDPHWIYPGEVLRIPGAPAAVAATDQTAAPRAEGERRVQTVGRASGPAAPTVFIGGVQGRRALVTQMGPSATEYPHTAVRAGEYYAAPWVDRSGGPSGHGRIIASAEVPGIAQATDRAFMMPYERGYITLPEGVNVARGDRLLAFADGEQLGNGAQVMLPTGILEVTRVAEGEAATVNIVQQFASIEVGQRVIPLTRFDMSTEARPEAVTGGLESEVRAVPSRTVLPTVGYYVILGATSSEGVQAGDIFTLYRPRTRVSGAGGSATIPEEPIALAQVVKVNNHGTTAMIIDQRHPAIKKGVQARLTGKMR